MSSPPDDRISQLPAFPEPPAATPRRRRRRFVWDLVIISALGLVGGFTGFIAVVIPHGIEGLQTYPAPHHVPRYPGGVSLRLAMVHDTIHERYPKHGPDWFEERNRRTETALRKEEAVQAAGAAPTARSFELVDDLAVGHERLGRHDRAIDLMRAKLKRQQALGQSGRDLYSSYANLGTFIVLRLIDRGAADTEAAKAELRESIELIRKAVEVNPEAHFGREEWQLALEEFLLAALNDPNLLLRYDMVGDPLEESEEAARGYTPPYFGLVNDREGIRRPALRAFAEDPDAADRADPEARSRVRGLIPRVGPGPYFQAELPPWVHQKAVPFDEPALGIIGMWQYGGGANPHFALALGEIMLRVRQRFIAWCAYERAVRLAAAVSPDPEIVRGFVGHCCKRQAALEGTMSAEEAAGLRPRFEGELAFGLRYQKAYQEYEARRIGEGAALDDPHFFDAFHAEHGPVASPSGPEEQIVIAEPLRTPFEEGSAEAFGAGLFALPVAVLLRLRRSWRRPAATSPA